MNENIGSTFSLCGLVDIDKDINGKLLLFYDMHSSCGINLTAIKDKDEFYLKHYADSVYYFNKYFRPRGALADIGSGGGFPGIVLAIFYKKLSVTLIESKSKKCVFLEEAVKGLCLPNVKIINDRAENIKGTNFDVITARGVSQVKDVIKYTWSISKPNTKWVLYKGEKLEAELNDAKSLIQQKELKVETVRLRKNLSQGLTALLAASLLIIFVSGCSGLKNAGKRINDPFYPEYYAARNLDSDDVIRLRSYAGSIDPEISDAASLIIGHYYLKANDNSYGQYLINKYYNSKSLNEQMKLFGKLWHAESLVKARSIYEAQQEIAAIKAMRKNVVYNKTLDIYCTRAGYKFTQNNYEFCIDSIAELNDNTTALQNKTKTDNTTMDNGSKTIVITPSVNQNQIDNATNQAINAVSNFDNMTYEEYAASQRDNSSEIAPVLDNDSTINIVDGDVMSDYVQGMIFAISRLGSSHKINSVSSSDLNAQKSAVNINSKTEKIDIGGNAAYIGINWDELCYIASNLKFINDYERIVISTPTDMLNIASIIEKNLKARNKYVKVIDYTASNFQVKLRNELRRSAHERLLMIGLGTEKEILSFIPIAKYLQSNPSRQRILLITSALDDVKTEPSYANYFKGAYILSQIKILGNDSIEQIAQDYEKFFGSKMTADNMIGYDTIIYLNSLINNDPKPNYMTNISGFINFKAHRLSRLYKFDDHLNLTEELPELIAGSDNSTPENQLNVPQEVPSVK